MAGLVPAISLRKARDCPPDRDHRDTALRAGPVPDVPFRAGQTVVIQPNVVTPDRKAGVQTGEMVLITDNGIERFHAVPRGFAIL